MKPLTQQLGFWIFTTMGAALGFFIVMLIQDLRQLRDMVWQVRQDVTVLSVRVDSQIQQHKGR